MIIQSLLVLIASLTVFLVLTEILTIDISYGDKTVIDFDLMIFGIRFTQTKKQNRKGRKKRFRPDFYTVMSIINTLIGESEITVRRISVFYPQSSPDENAFKEGLCSSLLYPALAYAKVSSKNFILGNITFENSANNNYRIALDITLELPLISFLIILMITRMRNRRKVKPLWRKTK